MTDKQICDRIKGALSASMMPMEMELECVRFLDRCLGGRWIPVEERLPGNEVDVLILCERRLYGIGELDHRISKHIAMAFHTDGKTNTENSNYTWELWDTNADYDEDADAYIIPEGWWERVLYGEEFSAVDDFVTHWMPLPDFPGKDGAV